MSIQLLMARARMNHQMGSLLRTGRYWRLYITANNGDATYTALAELELRGTVGGADLTTPSTPGTESSYLNTADKAPAAVDNVSNTPANVASSAGGSGFPYWLSYDLGSPQTVAELAIWPQARSDLVGRAPKDFLLQYSNVSITGPWTTAMTQTGITGWVANVAKTFAVPTP